MFAKARSHKSFHPNGVRGSQQWISEAFRGVLRVWCRLSHTQHFYKTDTMHRLLAVFHTICYDKKQHFSRNLRAWKCRELVAEMFYMRRIIACKIASTNLKAAVSKEYLANIYCILIGYFFRFRCGSHHIERSLINCRSGSGTAPQTASSAQTCTYVSQDQDWHLMS